LEDLRVIARGQGLDEAAAVRPANYADVVRQAAESVAPDTRAAQFVWRLCSAIAHGDLWPTLALGDRVELPGAADGVVRLKVTADMETLLGTTRIAVATTAYAWRLFDARRRGL
jgi:hypothetical protein